MHVDQAIKDIIRLARLRINNADKLLQIIRPTLPLGPNPNAVPGSDKNTPIGLASTVRAFQEFPIYVVK
jgi:hypothetical protein